MAEFIVLGVVAIVMLVDDLVPVNESFLSHGKFFDFLINFVKASSIVEEFKLVGSDGGGARSKSSNCERFHP